MNRLLILENYRADEARWALLPNVLFAVFVLVQIFRDVELIHDSFVLKIDIALRIASAGLMIAMAFAVDGRWGKYSYVILSISFFIIAPVVALCNSSFRPPERLFDFLSGMVGVAYIYFLLPIPLWLKIAAALVYSSVLLYSALFQKLYTPDDRFVIASTYAFLTLIGIPSAVAMNKLRVKNFQHQHERDREAQLSRALGDLSFDAVILVRGAAIVECNRAFQDLVDTERIHIIGAPVSAYLSTTAVLNENGNKSERFRGFVFGDSGGNPVEMIQKTVDIDGEHYACFSLRDTIKEELAEIQMDSQFFLERFEQLPLTKREREICFRILEGKTRFQIGIELFISDATVKKHTANIYEKLNISSKIDLFNKVHRP